MQATNAVCYNNYILIEEMLYDNNAVSEELLWNNHTSLSRKLDVTDLQAVYDENVKGLLSEKRILANILR